MEAGIKQRYNTLQRASISAKCKQLFGGFSMGLFVSVNLSNAGQCLPFKMAILAPTRSTTGDDSVAKGVVRTWTGQTRTILNSSAAVGRDQPKNYVMFWAKPPKRSVSLFRIWRSVCPLQTHYHKKSVTNVCFRNTL